MLPFQEDLVRKFAPDPKKPHHFRRRQYGRGIRCAFCGRNETNPIHVPPEDHEVFLRW